MVDVAVLGATGYTGMELIRLLHGHPEVRLSFLSSESSAGLSLAQVHPQFLKLVDEVIIKDGTATFMFKVGINKKIKL